MKILNWLKSLFSRQTVKKEDPSIFIMYTVDKDNMVHLTCSMPRNNEEVFAELLYNINSGLLLTDTLEIVNNQSIKSNQLDSFKKMIDCLTEIYTQEENDMKEEEEVSLNDSIIKPSDVFNNKNE